MRHAEMGYGYFHGGDPRKFWPDAEVCEPDEIERHRLACEAWNRSETPDPGGPHIPLVRDGKVCGHVTVAHFGMGTYEVEYDCEGDPECPLCHDDSAMVTESGEK